MDSITEIMQLCRLCLVKEEVNIPIFGEHGDIRHIFLKISACLPVKISKEDNLPKKICDGCSCKLEMLYRFWNTSVNSEKKLIQWLEQIGAEETSDKGDIANTNSLNTQHSISSNPVVLKQEVVELTDTQSAGEDLIPDLKVPSDEQDYLMQSQQLPYQSVEFQFQQDGFDTVIAEEESSNIETETQPKQRKRRAAAMKALASMESEGEDDPDLINTKIAKTEEESDDSAGEDPEPTTFVGIPSADDEQPGPSGIGKPSNDAPCLEESSILKRLIIGPSMTVTVANPSTITREMPDFESSPIKIKIKLETPDEYVEESFEPVGEVKEEKRKTKTNEKVHCDICDMTFKNYISFALHSIKHSGNKRYTCHMCTYTSASKYHFEMHVRAHEGSTAYKCEICNKAFTVSTHALEHKYYHTGEKPFQCEICGKHFTFSWFLTSHRRTQHWEIMTGTPLVKYDCTICNKHYTSSTGLKRHKLSRHNEEGIDVSVLCDICGKRLSNKEKLKFHRRIHTGYKPYTCAMCSKSFTRKEQLKEHERVHTGEKPYICKHCGKGFTQRSPLKIHERTHTGERPYKCRLCNKGFISKGVMDTHMKNCNGIDTTKTC